MYWHGHEMLMGLAGAAIGGFLLTAVANWTSRPPIAGLPLVLLCAAWLAGRLSLHAPLVSALADTGYWVGLWVLVANEILRAGNRRNYKILGVLALIGLSDGLYHVAELTQSPYQQQALWAQLWLIIVLINVIGGRVIPAFTGNWLRRTAAPVALTETDLPPAFGRIDQAAIAALVAFAAATVLQAPSVIAVMLGLLAGIMQAWRLARWKFYRTFSDPLVWMMHLSYLWIPVGIVLWTLSHAGWVPVSAAVHALTTGAITSMVISIGSRAAFGHTGRPLQSPPLLTACIVLISVSAILRVAASVWQISPALHASSFVWLLAFVCFSIQFIPILLRPAR
jgi:uncharacterized protein involved in response to NO